MKIKKKNKMYILFIFIILFITITTHFTISVKKSTVVKKEPYEPLKEDVSFLKDSVYSKLENDIYINNLFDVDISKYNISNPYYILNPYKDNNVLLIMFKTPSESSIEVIVNEKDKITYEKDINHILLVNNLQIGDNEITIIDENNNVGKINIFINEEREYGKNIDVRKIDNRIIISKIDEAGFYEVEYVLQDTYKLFAFKNNTLIAIDNNNYLIEIDKNKITSKIDLKELLQFKKIEYLNYNESNDYIGLIIDGDKYTYNEELVKVENFDNTNNLIESNYQLKSYIRYDLSQVNFKVLSQNEIMDFKNAIVYNCDIDIYNNYIVNNTGKNIVLISPRGYAYKNSDVYINLNFIPKGKYYIYLDENMSYNIGSYIEIR